ncbi:MAG: hypothetical protein KA072_12225 [Thermoanaerobaculaceae bacterium]|nr:hypothetical protein [Thermoanaerobaculaceae bacterium]MDI9622253.1 hypothetical protein [Acidobacteriota bacterium]NLH11871.1 hypothetical protein [Holophagae bacterium]HPW56304.1 hypothetical protein [Thermoanaerobaculaceae bacterium]
MANGEERALEWRVAIPLLDNPFIWIDLIKALAVPLVVFGGIIVFVLSGDDRPDWGGALKALAIAIGVVAALFVFAAAVVFRNRLEARFVLNEKGAAYESGCAARAAQKAGLVVGALSGSPLLLGGSLVASSMNAVGIRWRDVRKATPFRRWRTITLSNSWRPVLRLYCPDDQIYEAAWRLVTESTAARKASPL